MQFEASSITSFGEKGKGLIPELRQEEGNIFLLNEAMKERLTVGENLKIVRNSKQLRLKHTKNSHGGSGEEREEFLDFSTLLLIPRKEGLTRWAQR